MIKKLKYIIIILFFLNSHSYSKESFFDKAKNLYEDKKYEESKFLLQRNIVFHPKDSKSYLYLAKIYNTEENEREEEKNINTALLLDPNNEDAMYMLINLKLKRSDYDKVKELIKSFKIICSNFCEKIELINERLTNIEAKDES